MQKFMHLRRQVLNLALSGQLESVGTDLNQQGPFAIPAHWHWQPLKELGTLVMGHTPKSTVPEFWEPATIVWVTPSDLTAHHEIYLSNSARKISPQGCTHSRTSLVPVGTVLYTTRATIGAIAIAQIKGIGLLAEELGLRSRQVYDYFLDGFDIKIMSMDGYPHWTDGQREGAMRLFRKFSQAVCADIRQGEGLLISLESHLRREWLCS